MKGIRTTGWTAGALVSVFGALLVGAAPTHAAPSERACPKPGGTTVVQDLPATYPADCDMRGVVLSDGTMGALVPAPGQGVTAYADEHGAGDGRDLTVERARDRSTTIRRGRDDRHRPADGSDDESFSTLAVSPCSDGTYNDSGQGWTDGYTWRLNLATYPHSVTQAAWESSMKAAMNEWDRQYNRCSLALDVANPPIYYGGNTTRYASIDDNANCGAWDGYSVVHAGDLPGSYYGYACTWWHSNLWGRNSMIEADLKYDGWTYRWTTSSSSCDNQLDVHSGAAHEFGHALGLNHTSSNDADHPRLVMSPSLQKCHFDERRLAKGDYDGIAKIY